MTPLDLALSRDGRFLYVLAAGTDRIVSFAVDGDGGLTRLDTAAAPIAAVGIAVR